MVKLFAPFIPKGTLPAIKQVLDSGTLTQGQLVQQFEEGFCRDFNVKYAVSLNSGTSALEIAYELLGLKKGDEVITTPLTCVATNLPLLRMGAKIVWADILEDTLCIDPKSVKEKLTSRTKAIVQVHLGGVKADVGESHLPVVSDACQALGVFTGDYTCCSFQAIKHITTADGGMLIVNDEAEYREAKLMRWYGIDRDKPIDNSWASYKTRMMSFDVELPGSKRHMNDLSAAMGLQGLRYYGIVLRHRQKLFEIYKSRLKDIPGIKVIDGEQNVCWLMTLLVEKRDDFARMLFINDIETNIVQVRNDIYPVFGGRRANLPVMDSVEDRYISLPIGMHVSPEGVEFICDCIDRGW